MRGSQAASRLLAAGLVACCAFGATFAGADDGGRLTKSEFVERATKQCDRLLDASNELTNAQAPGATGRRVARYLRRAADELGELVEAFDELEPPRRLEADTDELVDVLDGYAEGLDALADRVKRGQTFRVALEKNQDLVTRLNGSAQRATEVVTRLGLTGCLLPA